MSQQPSPPGKRFRCWIGMHKWVSRVNDEGGRYFSCHYCGKYKESGAAIMRYRG